ncbi:MAG: transcriptional regulator [Oceanicaulis sp.]|uniref:ArsR/SmtB family transcription factor n=1 Tax=Oceanicaulis sp. UBA2681 TaxID=1947007 RepID=UPI000C0A4E67|nr:metalloregulator ArsR/SmtB family transcription factor [Oceanicaulis sp. UBA2681]MAP48842.1 transcriptional regulator [Oceanicaulis sp.]MBL4537581.1 helix-turn-helix transcriptional regulator [Oceanicaulis sp.]HCR66382.1 transcriptional regulator [Oceanicaulis sp.]|tara:strand:- start:222 stop:581 length:360 start_codon:yes stop_codon:yes gene_type:complete
MKESTLASEIAASQFAALAHETRLIVFRTVMNAGPEGVSAGDLAVKAQVTPSNLSAHLTVLVSAGLLDVRRDGRRRYYFAALPAVRGLLNFLIMECCDGNPDVCDLQVSELTGLHKEAC